VNSATFDSNVYVSALQFGGVSARLLGIARLGVFRLDISEAILSETTGVLRDKFRWDGYSIQNARQMIGGIAHGVDPVESVDICKDDPDDNRILECALAARSNAL